MNLGMDNFTVVMAVLVGVVSVARVARLLTYDVFPPTKWLREQAYARLPESWQPLATCAFCLAPYLMAGQMAWFWASDGHWTWWVANGWLAASYAASIVVAYDQPEE